MRTESDAPVTVINSMNLPTPRLSIDLDWRVKVQEIDSSEEEADLFL